MTERVSTEDRFGPFLRVARNACQLTQRALAGEVGLDHTYISKLERGKAHPPSISTLQRMAAVLRVPPTLMCNVAGRINRDMTKPELEGHVLELQAQLESLTTERDTMAARVADLETALGFYGDDENMNDIEYSHGQWTGFEGGDWTPDCGRIARAALAKVR